MKNSFIDVASIIVLAGVFVLNILFRNQFDGGSILFIASLLIVLVGITIWLIGKKTLGEFFSTSRYPKGFVTKGIYSKIRHPMYYSGIVIYIGTALFFRSWVGLGLVFFLVIPILYYFIKKEEGFLREKYKDQYLVYREKTII